MSGTGALDPDSSSVLSPEVVGAGAALAQAKLNPTSVGANAAVGVKAMTKLCAAPCGISTAVLAVPVTWLVAGSVVWKAKLAGTLVAGVIVHDVAVPGPVLMIVANAVAAIPTWTERLIGNTAASNETFPLLFC